MSKKITVIVSLVVLLVTAAFYWSAFSGRKENVKKIDLSEKVVDSNNESSEESIKIAVSAMVSPQETLVVYGDILDYIGEKLGKKVEMVQRKTYDEVNDLVENQEVSVAFVCAGPYVNGHDKFGMEIIAVPQMYGDNFYYAYIIVPKDSPVTSFNQLEGKTFAFTDPKSNTGKLVPVYMLAKDGKTPDSFFKKQILTGSHDNSIELVSKKMVDGASVDHLIYEYIKSTKPELVAGTKIIEKYGPYGMPPVVVHPAMDEKIKIQLRNILLDMNNDLKGNELLGKLKMDKFVLSEDANYTSVREMENWIRNGESR